MSVPPQEPSGGTGRAARPRRRLVVVGALAVAALAALLVAVAALGDGEPKLNANPISPARDAPLTRGRDVAGAQISIPQAGRPALVTFLFTHCPDVCPLAAQAISRALDESGVAPGEIDVVAISVDPRGDTPAAVRAFLERHRLTGRMHYIVGSTAELQPLWKSWMIAAQPDGANGSTHSARVVLVDRDGRQVGSYSAGMPIDTANLAADIRTLAD